MYQWIVEKFWGSLLVVGPIQNLQLHLADSESRHSVKNKRKKNPLILICKRPKQFEDSQSCTFFRFSAHCAQLMNTKEQSNDDWSEVRVYDRGAKIRSRLLLSARLSITTPRGSRTAGAYSTLYERETSRALWKSPVVAIFCKERISTSDGSANVLETSGFYWVLKDLWKNIDLRHF